MWTTIYFLFDFQFSSVSPPPPPVITSAPDIIFAEPPRPIVFGDNPNTSVTVAELAISPTNSELQTATYSFALRAAMLAGDTIASSPAPTVEQASYPSGQPALTFGTITISGNKQAILVPVSVTGGTEGTVYETVCTITTVAGKILKCRGDYVLVGFNGVTSITTAELEISPDGSEKEVALYSFALRPALAAGDTIAASPIPVMEQVSYPSGQPSLTFSAITILNYSTEVAAYVTVSGGTEGVVYETICTVWTTQGNILKCRGNYVLTAMS